MRRRSCAFIILLISSAAARANEPVDAGAEVDVSCEGDVHVVAEAAASPSIDPADACEAASQQSPSTTTRPAVHAVADAHGPVAAREGHTHATEHVEPLEHAEHVVEPMPKSLAARQGLLLPAAFLAAASALSSLLVYAIRGRTVASMPLPDPHNAAHAHEPAAH